MEDGGHTRDVVVGSVWLDMLDGDVEGKYTDDLLANALLADPWALRLKERVGLVLTPTNVAKEGV
ncbi:uncharacterized protein PV07_08851 [Cladophialophora immunda]|uniref:Uncharacterized protein n=1 Tax=Cladophialophora immunda TaxID=569365 RepID=A0A0D2C5D5_9EURO|nr:uncharacterized protein PV07_08851 [Cladophialophora immunda]KIW25690.1 hypothetical protein PV07_08851 [Cladophialophora immunda]